MLFSSPVFCFAFLPLTLVAYYFLGRWYGRIASRVFLALASFVFYGWFNPVYLLLIASSIVINYGCSWGIEQWRHKRLALFVFWLGIVFNLGLLGYFKYRDFFVQTVNQFLASDIPLLKLLLPLGISFFTFQQIAFLVDIRNDRLQQRYSLLDYVIFVTFFPQLIAGPIVLPDEMMSQFAKSDSHRLQTPNMAAGLWLFSVGIAKKIILADFFAEWADGGFAMVSLSLLAGWRTALGYTLQIYYDFSGYCDMAIGLGLMFNVRLPQNFDSPYRSTSIQEFWRRWHMTLGRFLTMFVYRPLGGSKCRLPRTLLNILCTFLLSGLWHGAGWLFVLWGGLHGLALILQRLYQALRWRPMPKFLGVALTFLFTLLAWVLFRAETWGDAKKVYMAMAGFSTMDWESALASYSANSLTMFVLGVAILFLPRNAASAVDGFRPTRMTAMQTVVLLVSAIFMMNRMSPFIYFNF